MLNVYVIRHGQTEWNAEKRMQGQLNSELTEQGKKHAELLGNRLKDTEFKRIYSSPSKRALETAQLICGEKRLAIEEDERLLEIHLGDWQGKTEEEIKTEFPADFYSYWNEPSRFVNEKGEIFQDVKNRVADFFHELERKVTDGNVLVVTHGVVISTLYLICRDAPIGEIWSPPAIQGTSLTIIQINEGMKELVLEACVDHCS